MQRLAPHFAAESLSCHAHRLVPRSSITLGVHWVRASTILDQTQFLNFLRDNKL